MRSVVLVLAQRLVLTKADLKGCEAHRIEESRVIQAIFQVHFIQILTYDLTNDFDIFWFFEK